MPSGSFPRVSSVPGKRLRRAAICVLVTLTVAATLLPAAPASAQSRKFSFKGRGWGHAVGMSQWGARGLAERGWGADRILAHYYRSTALKTLPPPNGIRVGLFHGKSETRISSPNGKFDLHDRAGKRRATANVDESWRAVPVGADRVTIYNAQGNPSFTSVVPVTLYYRHHRSHVTLTGAGGLYFRGRIDLDVDRATGKLRAILILGFEEYLYGIAEMPSSWHSSALAAQAIAARTYALEKIQRLGQNRPGCNCAVYGTTADQVYTGKRAETPRWGGAVNRTRGSVITYEGRSIQAFYSASSGGLTESNENVWNGTPLPYLRGVCDPAEAVQGKNPHNNWTVTIDGAELDRRLRDAGYDVGIVSRVNMLLPRGFSGRVTPVRDQSRGGVRIVGSRGEARLSGERFRSILGAKSTLFHYHLKGGIRNRWEALNCAPGTPAADQIIWRNLDGTVRGVAQNFAKGRLFRNASTRKVFWVYGSILVHYDSLRRNGTDFGLPTSDEYGIPGGRRTDFERGYITFDAATGRTTAHPR